MLEANARKERGEFLSLHAPLHDAASHLCRSLSGGSLPLPPAPVTNGFDHDRVAERHSTAFSDFDDDEEEDYPREVSPASVPCLKWWPDVQ